MVLAQKQIVRPRNEIEDLKIIQRASQQRSQKLIGFQKLVFEKLGIHM
jgi:hypothetical protein